MCDPDNFPLQLKKQEHYGISSVVLLLLVASLNRVFPCPHINAVYICSFDRLKSLIGLKTNSVPFSILF